MLCNFVFLNLRHEWYVNKILYESGSWRFFDLCLFGSFRSSRQHWRSFDVCLQKKEREFDDYLHEKFVQAKADFRELLKETKLITYRSHAMIEVTEQHFKDIEKILEVIIYNKRSLFTINFIN